VLLLQSGCAAVRTCPSEPSQSKVVKELARSARSWDGNPLPPYPQGQPQVTILRIGIPAGVRLDMHRHPVINAGVLLAGELTVVAADGKTLHLKAGDPIVEVVDTLHYGINEGTVPAEIIVFYADVVEGPATVVAPQ
jgi:quercetin dioxygenase-like cupin family protein